MGTRKSKKEYSWPFFETVVSLGLVLACVGCSGRPSRVEMQTLDPESAAAEAMGTLDSNSDTFIDQEEVKTSPGLANAFKQFDENGDGQLTEEEIRNRLQSWIEDKIAVFGTSVSITMDKRPLVGATVVFDPEPFLGESFQPMEGVTSKSGRVKFPKPAGLPISGVLTGLYRVKISLKQNGKEVVPEKYNEQTILGKEISAKATNMDRYVLSLRSR